MDLKESLRLKVVQKGLSKIGENTLNHSERILEISSPEKVYNSLQIMEKNCDEFDFILIDNLSYKSHIVLLSHSEPIVCLGYDENGEYEAFSPLSPIKSKGVNHQMFAYRYIIFFKLSKLEELPDHTFDDMESSDKPKEQQMLSKYMKAINGEIPMTDELKEWWQNRY